MSDKTSIKTPPKTTISIQIDITPADILPFLQMALTGEEITKIDTDTTHQNHTGRTTNEIYQKRA